MEEIQETDNTVENILRQEEEKNQGGKVLRSDWNELVSVTVTVQFLKALESDISKYQAAMRSVFYTHTTSKERQQPLTYPRCAHPVLVEALTKISSRGLVYQSWVRLIEQEIVQGASRDGSVLHLALTWFLVMYPRFKLNESILYFDRLQLFVSFSNQAHASLAHGAKELVRMCLAQQPVVDLIQILLVEIEMWVAAKSPPGNPPQEPIPHDECVRSLFSAAFRDPDVEVEHRVHKLLRAPATRTDTALVIVSVVKTFLASRHHVNDLLKKVGWCLNCLLNNIRPFPPPAPGIPPLLDSIDYIIHTFPGKLDRQSKENLASLKQVLTHMFDQKMMQASFSEPKYDIETAKSAYKPPVVKEQEENVKPKEDDFTTIRPNTARYHKEGYERVNAAVAKIAHIEDVWLQTESLSVPTGNAAGTSGVAVGKGSVFNSVSKGNLIFTMEQILWIPAASQDDYVALGIKYERITQHTGGSIKGEGPSNGTEHHYLSVQAHEVSSVVYYFFPFTMNEVSELQKLLQDLCGKGPAHEMKYTQIVTDQKITAQRSHMLRQLRNDPRPNLWIADMDTLTAVIKNLVSVTANRTDVSYQYELERLFHSCRRNDEVAVETISMFREMWESSPEAIHLKILAVIDRILDRALMHVDSPAFWALNHWLDHVEKTLNPYKNSKTLEIIYELKHRVQTLKKHTLVPLSLIDLLQIHELKV